MKKLLRFLWTGSWHDHHWEIHEIRTVVDKNDDDILGDKYILRCKDCGEMKLFKTYFGFDT
jgi:uncharacterized protein CbrC (UPF0167 family)